MEIIASYHVKFETAEDVRHYLDCEPIDLPEDDLIVDDAIDFKLGFDRLVVFLADHTIIRGRDSLIGLAVDGEPIALHGAGFRRINCVTSEDELNAATAKIDADVTAKIEKITAAGRKAIEDLNTEWVHYQMRHSEAFNND